MENSKFNQIIDTISVILISLTAITTAWCAYQSNQWGGQETKSILESQMYGRLSTEKQVIRQNFYSFDATLIMNFIEAYVHSDEKIMNFYLERTRPQMRKLLREWIDLTPMTNKHAPHHPLLMPGYKKYTLDPMDDEINKLKRKERYHKDKSVEADNISDRYILMTVIFATIFLLAGVAPKLRNTNFMTFIVAFASLIFAFSLILMLTYPVILDF